MYDDEIEEILETESSLSVEGESEFPIEPTFQVTESFYNSVFIVLVFYVVYRFVRNSFLHIADI